MNKNGCYSILHFLIFYELMIYISIKTRKVSGIIEIVIEFVTHAILSEK